MINEELKSCSWRRSRFINGLRLTDKATMDVAQMVLVGKTNKEIVSILNQMGGKAVGICGIDGNVIECEQYKTNRRTGNRPWIRRQNNKYQLKTY